MTPNTLCESLSGCAHDTGQDRQEVKMQSKVNHGTGQPNILTATSCCLSLVDPCCLNGKGIAPLSILFMSCQDNSAIQSRLSTFERETPDQEQCCESEHSAGAAKDGKVQLNICIPARPTRPWRPSTQGVPCSSTVLFRSLSMRYLFAEPHL